MANSASAVKKDGEFRIGCQKRWRIPHRLSKKMANSAFDSPNAEFAIA
jgi:hypothetical protein